MEARRNAAGVLFVLPSDKKALRCAKGERLSLIQINDIYLDTDDSWQVFDCHCVFGRLDESTLLLVTEWTHVGRHPFGPFNNPIYRIDRVRALSSCNDNDQATSSTYLSRRETVVNNIIRLINDYGGFYVCPGVDITQTLLRNSCKTDNSSHYAWNYRLWETESDVSVRTQFYMPIIRGFVAQTHIALDQHINIEVTLFGRRSRHNAGMRYLKRGIDDAAHCANFVETELIAAVAGHCVSTVQVRGSVPVCWSQRGYRYRPPPVLDQPQSVSQVQFDKHMKALCKSYNEEAHDDNQPLVVCINLVEQIGRESILAETFLEHVLKLNAPWLTYVAFDYHAACRGGRADRIRTVLVNSLNDHITRIGFTWSDAQRALVCRQNGIIRTNCVDCLDRTNVVQTAICIVSLEYSLYKLGITDRSLPTNAVRTLMHLWADHGDAISVQYAGTAALKGDVTRSGQRQLGGLLRDGVNSASRYYLCHMRDAQTQTAIDALLGVQATPTLVHYRQSPEDQVQLWKFVDSVHKLCAAKREENTLSFIASWPLFDADDDIVVVLLTREMLIVAEAPSNDAIEWIDLHLLSRVEVGAGKSNSQHLCVRITLNDGRWYQWRSAGTRLFNNRPMALKNVDEQNEYTHAIAEQIVIACSLVGVESLQIKEVPVLTSPPAPSEHIVHAVAGVLFSTTGTLFVEEVNEHSQLFSKSCAELNKSIEVDLVPNTVPPPATFIIEPSEEQNVVDESSPSLSPIKRGESNAKLSRIASKGKDLFGLSKGIASSSFSKLSKHIHSTAQKMQRDLTTPKMPQSPPMPTYHEKHLAAIHSSKSQIMLL